MSMLIEDPSDFDIWAKIRANDSLAFAEWLADRFGISKTDAFRAISPAVKGGKYVQVLSGYGWNSLPALVSELPLFVEVGTAVFAEQDCSPDSNVEFCEIHRLFHRPGRCPICVGNYISEGHRSM